jgi:hypothetical protein
MNTISACYATTALAILLTILFTALKLLGGIAWSWIWVISPFWITYIGLFLLVLFTYVVLACFSKPVSHRRGALDPSSTR